MSRELRGALLSYNTALLRAGPGSAAVTPKGFYLHYHIRPQTGNKAPGDLSIKGAIMGAKLSKKKKGYDVSDPKSKNGETPVTDAAKVEDGAPSTGAESTPGKDGAVEEAVVAAVAAGAEGAGAPEEPKSSSSDEKAPAAKEEATPQQKSAVGEAAPVAMEQAAAAEQPAPAEKEKAVEAAPVSEKKPLVVEEKVTVAEKAPEEPAPVAIEEQKSAAPVEEPNKPLPVEEPAASTEETAQAEPKIKEPAAELLVAMTVTENSSAPASEELVQAEGETESAALPEEPHVDDPVESVVEPDVVLASTEAPLKDQVPERKSEANVEEKVVPTIVPEPEAEPAGETLVDSDTKPEPKHEAETVVEAEEQVQPESVEAPEPEPEPKQSSKPEVDQSPDPEQVEEPKLQPTVAAANTTDPDSPEADSSDALENHPANEEPTEAAEPAPEIIISQSVSNSSMTVECDQAALEEATCPEKEVETNLENGDLGSPSIPENTAAPAVNGECGDNTAALAAHTEECVNGNEKFEELPVKEQSEFELKKDLCGDVQEVPDMVEAVSTEVTQAV